MTGREMFEFGGAALLFATAVLALWGVRRDATNLSLVAGLGTIYLGVDEALDLHERLGSWVYADLGWPQPPVVNHHDDVLVIAVAAGTLVAVAWFRREILRERGFATLFATGLALFAAAVAWDSLADPSRASAWWTEESLELVGAGAMVAAFGWRLRGLGGGEQHAASLLEVGVAGEP